VEVGRIYLPAGEQGEVGGDYYDFIAVDRKRLGIVIADVSGKGLRAATGTAMGKYTVRAYVLENPRPGEVLVRTNNALLHQWADDTAFLTLFYAVWEPATHHLTWANAGHPYPVLYQKSLGRCIQLRSPHTMLLGVLPNQSFAEERLLIRKGDVLVAYTDGVIEARCGLEQFGMGRIEDVLCETAGQPPQVIADALLRRVADFRDDAWSDDLTILVLKFG
jgi:sigma-B regulation protein RsbU (phosphoserine phosphatase)